MQLFLYSLSYLISVKIWQISVFKQLQIRNIINLEKLELMSDCSIEFFCGCLSGWAQVLTMQPFQMIKVRLANQSLLNPIYKGIGDCFGKIYKEQGALAFYKGTLSPLIGIGAQVALQFGTNELVKKVMFKLNIEDTDQKQSQQLPLQLIFLSGILTGIPSSLVTTPVDHTRIKMQHQKNSKYKSSISAGVQITKKHGIRGLYQGFYPTVLRQVIALGVYFGSYEAIVRKIDRQRQNSPNAAVSFVAGGLAGSLSWLFTYPIDYLKTIIQSDDTENRKYHTTIRAATIKYQEQGIRTFFKGLGVTLLRSFPVNGVGFVTFQYFRNRLSQPDSC